MPNHPLGPLAANGSSKHDGAIYRGNQAAARGSQPTLSVDEQIDCKQAVLASRNFLPRSKSIMRLPEPPW